MESPSVETATIIEIGCGFEERVKRCWLEQGLSTAMAKAFPNQVLEVTGLDLWWDPNYDFEFPNGRFRGTMEETTLPPQVDAIIWRNPNPQDVIDNGIVCLDGVLAVVMECVKRRLKNGGRLFFETDLEEPLAQNVESTLMRMDLSRKGPFKSATSFYKTKFGAEYEKAP